MIFIVFLILSTLVNAMDTHIQMKEPDTSQVPDHVLKHHINTFLKKDNPAIMSRIIPHLSEKLSTFPATENEFQQVLENPQKFENTVHSLIPDSLEDAFKKQDDTMQQNQQDYAYKIRIARYQLIASIAGGILTTLSGVLITYFNKH